MGHFRLCALMLVEEIIKALCIQTPIIIQDMCMKDTSIYVKT